MAKVVILAGGRGTRLSPYTTVLPKPLLPLGNRTILESILISLREFGLTEVVISIGYLGHLIRAVIGDGSNYGVHVEYIVEQDPLGTAGCLSLLPFSDRNEVVLVINGDTYTNFNYNLAVEALEEKAVKAVVVCKLNEEKSEFGIIKKDEQSFLLGIDEKPTSSFLVSTGINAFRQSLFVDYLPSGFFNMPDFFYRLIQAQESVYCLETDSFWFDLGREADLISANQKVNDQCG